MQAQFRSNLANRTDVGGRTRPFEMRMASSVGCSLMWKLKGAEARAHRLHLLLEAHFSGGTWRNLDFEEYRFIHDFPRALRNTKWRISGSTGVGKPTSYHRSNLDTPIPGLRR